MTMPSTIGTQSPLFCTDEYIATLCYGDYAALTPGSNLMAKGTDGAFQASDLWTLQSATNDFAALGVVVGHTIRLESSAVGTLYKSSGQCFAVGGTASHQVTLRRIGQPDGKGFPPGPASGATGITFTVATLTPRIEDVTFDLCRQFGIAPKIAPPVPDLALRPPRPPGALRADGPLPPVPRRYADEGGRPRLQGQGVPGADGAGRSPLPDPLGPERQQLGTYQRVRDRVGPLISGGEGREKGSREKGFRSRSFALVNVRE